VIRADADRVNRVSKPHAAIALCFTYLPLAALAVVGGVVLGWKVPVALVAVLCFLVYRGRAAKARGTAPGRVRTLLELLAFALTGAVLGGVVAGGVGVILGFAIGFCFRLGEVPITRRRGV
jgi:hypothetical protein